MSKSNLKELQQSRQSNYGSFSDQVVICDKVMALLKQRNIQVNGQMSFPEGFETTLFYMVTKLVRLAATPTHDDSALDLSSYADLWYKEIMSGKTPK